jgi:hypothetical protein
MSHRGHEDAALAVIVELGKLCGDALIAVCELQVTMHLASMESPPYLLLIVHLFSAVEARLTGILSDNSRSP